MEVYKLLKSGPVFCKKCTTNICTINNIAASRKFFVCLYIRISRSCVLIKNCNVYKSCMGTIGNYYMSLKPLDKLVITQKLTMNDNIRIFNLVDI